MYIGGIFWEAPYPGCEFERFRIGRRQAGQDSGDGGRVFAAVATWARGRPSLAVELFNLLLGGSRAELARTNEDRRRRCLIPALAPPSGQARPVDYAAQAFRLLGSFFTLKLRPPPPSSTFGLSHLLPLLLLFPSYSSPSSPSPSSLAPSLAGCLYLRRLNQPRPSPSLAFTSSPLRPAHNIGHSHHPLTYLLRGFNPSPRSSITTSAAMAALRYIAPALAAVGHAAGKCSGEPTVPPRRVLGLTTRSSIMQCFRNYHHPERRRRFRHRLVLDLLRQHRHCHRCKRRHQYGRH